MGIAGGPPAGLLWNWSALARTTLFSSAEGDGKPGFHYFAAKPVDAKFFVAPDNRDDATPEHFKRWMITNAGGYEDVTYQPRGRSCFV